MKYVALVLVVISFQVWAIFALVIIGYFQLDKIKERLIIMGNGQQQIDEKVAAANAALEALPATVQAAIEAETQQIIEYISGLNPNLEGLDGLVTRLNGLGANIATQVATTFEPPAPEKQG